MFKPCFHYRGNFTRVDWLKAIVHFYKSYARVLINHSTNLMLELKL